MTLRQTHERAHRLAELLKLTVPPIGIAFLSGRPDVIPADDSPVPTPTADGRTGRAPASCSFWIEAAGRVFATEPADHRNCSVGSVTHGLIALEEAARSDDVQAMLAAGWITEAMFPDLPAIAERAGSIVYGPLERLPLEPDVVLLRIDAKQAMLVSDAIADVAFEGKPQCHVIPLAKERGRISVSVGCIASRVRTGMANDELTCAVPHARLAELVAALEAARGADEAIARYAAEDKRRFERA